METGLEDKSDEGVVQALCEAVRLERLDAVRVLRCLIEFSKRRLLEKTPYPSLFDYCAGCLGYSESESYKRVRAAEAAMRYPPILKALERRRTDLSRIVTISRHIKAYNGGDLLENACAMKQRDLEFYVAGLSPKPVPRDTVRTLPLGRGLPSVVESAAPAPALAPAPPVVPESIRVEPLTEALARIYFTTDRQTVADLDRACRLLRRRRGNCGPVIARALKLLLAEIDPDLKKPAKPRPSDPASRRVPQHVRDFVWRRDEGQCTFRDANGVRCCAREGLQFDHIKPWSAGGRSDDRDNIRLLCPLHNLAAAREWFSDEYVDRAIEKARRLRSPPAEPSG